jgi:magnesium chelatase family protein
MSISKINSAAVVGLDATPVEVEVDIGAGLPQFLIVGLPDKAIEEAKERVRSAIKNSGGKMPEGRITCNLAPADLPKAGPLYDLPIAIGILAALEQIRLPKKSLFIGELALDGRLRRINGILPIMLMAKTKGFVEIYLPQENLKEASLVSDMEIIPVDNLKNLIFALRGERKIKKIKTNDQSRIISEETLEPDTDLAYVKGQEQAKRALEIAAAGAHNLIFIGPPGSGKTLLARALPSILPKMNLEESLEVTKIYSVAGLITPEAPLIYARPFRTPHHTSSNIALVGGGSYPKPGEITLAHRGVLFMDELPEFGRSVLEALRQPLEDRIITISRAAGSLQFPAHFSLVAAMNPCPCGFLNDPIKQCICTPTQVLRYQKKISGPLLDRIDLHVEVPRVKYEKLADEKVAESSSSVRARVEGARDIQAKRFSGQNIRTNSEMRIIDLKKYCRLDEESRQLLKSAVDQLHLSARSFHRILKLARTIADIEMIEKLKASHIAEALQYRPKEYSL